MRWRDPLLVELPVARLRRPFALLVIGLPIVLMVVGITTAVIAAVASEHADTEGIGTFGVEFGAVLWFAGAVTLGARASATVLRAVVLFLTAATGAAFIVLALVRDWTGAGLTLAMEFGVGALAIPVVDVVLLGFLHARLDRLAYGPEDRVVRLRLGRRLVDTSWQVGRDTADPE